MWGEQEKMAFKLSLKKVTYIILENFAHLLILEGLSYGDFGGEYSN